MKRWLEIVVKFSRRVYRWRERTVTVSNADRRGSSSPSSCSFNSDLHRRELLRTFPVAFRTFQSDCISVAEFWRLQQYSVSVKSAVSQLIRRELSQSV